MNLAAQPPRIRDPVFPDTMDFAFDRVMVLGVWNNHTRLLLPASETTPAIWGKWQNIVDAVVIKGWAGWALTDALDSTRAHPSLDPCVTCLRNIRVPENEPTRCAGASANWWGRWNPRSHTVAPTASNTCESWAGFPTVDANDTSSLGRGLLSSGAAKPMGCTYLPDCKHMWRTAGPCRDGILSYVDDVAEEYR